MIGRTPQKPVIPFTARISSCSAQWSSLGSFYVHLTSNTNLDIRFTRMEGLQIWTQNARILGYVGACLSKLGRGPRKFSNSISSRTRFCQQFIEIINIKMNLKEKALWAFQVSWKMGFLITLLRNLVSTWKWLQHKFAAISLTRPNNLSSTFLKTKKREKNGRKNGLS